MILGSSRAKAKITNLDAINDPDDKHELFVVAWCSHPDLIPDEKIMAILELEEEHDGGPPLYLRPWLGCGSQTHFPAMSARRHHLCWRVLLPSHVATRLHALRPEQQQDSSEGRNAYRHTHGLGS